MAVISSSYVQDVHAQPNGSKYVLEQHVIDANGTIYSVGPYLAPANMDISANMAVNVTNINNLLAEAEVDKVLVGNFVVTHQTLAQFASRFWYRVQNALNSADKVEFSRLIWWLYNNVQKGNFTSDQVRNSYNNFFSKSLNTAQWNSLVNTRIIPIRDRYQAMLDEGPV